MSDVRVEYIDGMGASAQDLSVSYKAKFREKDAEYCSLFLQLESVLSELANMGIDNRRKGEVLLSSEYLLVSVRSKLLGEYASLNKVMGMSSHGLLVRLFKERRDVVLTYMQRLTELRGDMECVQRTRYVDNWQK